MKQKRAIDENDMTRTAQMQAVLIYKVSDRGTWARAQDAGAFAGSPDDQRDGFIHFSSARQLAGTLAKYYASQDDLVLAAVDPARLGAALRWEPARGGVVSRERF